MVNPVKVVENVVQVIPKAASATVDAVSDAAPKVSETLSDAGGDLLRAYHGIKPGKLFENFNDFLTDFRTKLGKYSEDLPKELFKKLSTMADNKDFSLNKAVSEYYSGLEKCTTLDDVRKMYPEIKLPDKTPRQMTVEDIKRFISPKTVEAVKKLPTPEAQEAFFNKFFDDILSEQVKSSEIYPEILKIRDGIKTEILSGKFNGISDKSLPGIVYAPGSTYKYGNSPKKNILARLISDDYENIMLNILRQHYIEGKPITEIRVKTANYDLSAQNIRRRLPFGIMNSGFRNFLAAAEKNAKQFQELKNLDKTEISSRVMTETWKKSRLRADLGTQTRFGKDWSIVKAVWHKTMFPETTFYPTEKLIDAYIMDLYTAGKRTPEALNPILKYIDNQPMDKRKIALLKRMYRDVKQLDRQHSVLNSQSYQDFKAKFDLDGMKKSIESLEEHYKNSFFKYFWTDERKARFTQALNENRKLAKENVEISDDILVDAMNKIFSEELK